MKQLVWLIAVIIVWALWLYILRINNKNEEKRLEEKIHRISVLKNEEF